MEKNALKYYTEGFNCTQAILKSCSGHLDVSEEIMMKLSTGTGFGMYIGETCGAVTGAIMAFGLKHGNGIPGDKTNLRKVYKLIKMFETEFKEKHCSLNCKELKSVYKKDCNILIEDSAKIIKKLLEIE